MRAYAQVAPTFWTRGSGKRIRGDKNAQLVALYLMSSPATNMVGIFHLALPTLCHETGLPLEDALKGLQRCSEEQIAFWDEAEELVWVPALARYQLGEEMKLGKGGKPDHRVKGVERALAPFKGHRFYDFFLERYRAAYLLDLDSEGVAPKGLPSPHVPDPDPDPVPDPDPERARATPSATTPEPEPAPPADTALAAAPHPKPSVPFHRRDPFAASFAQPDELDRWVFQRWTERFGKTGAEFDAKRALCLADRRVAGMTRQDAEDALAGAAADEYVNGKKDGKPHDRLAFIFGDADRYEEFRDSGRRLRLGAPSPGELSPEAAARRAAQLKRQAEAFERQQRELIESLPEGTAQPRSVAALAAGIGGSDHG